MPRYSGKVFKKVTKARHLRINKSSLRVSQHNSTEDNCEAKKTSSSQKKLGTGVEFHSTKDEVNSGFRIIDLEIMCSIIRNSCACGNCGNKSLRLYDSNDRDGIVCNMHLFCDSCETDIQFKTSTAKNWVYEANIRFCYGMRCVGVGREGSNLFCAIMNMPSPSASYSTLNNHLLNALETECNSSLSAAAKEAVLFNKDNQTEVNDPLPSTDLCVSCDGTWMKRGHTSLHGVSSVISVDTGKVLDLQVTSKYCSICAQRKTLDNKEEEKQWQIKHKINCSKNYDGSSGGMEQAGMKLIFHRSEMRHGVRYVKYLGDGDSSAFKSVVESKPYGNGCNIEKLECVGHIQKRMGGRLLKLKREHKGVKLKDGKPLGGPHRLTDKEIHNLQIYYGKAIRQNTGDLKAMQKAVWAIYFHKLSTDEKPVHELCDISWCKYKQAKAENKTYSHKHSLPEAVVSIIKPTFQFLAHPDLLKKCTHGGTQNPNESFNSLIWKRCPKTTFSSSIVVKIATYDACLVFNDGNTGRIRTLTGLGFVAGCFTGKLLKKIDNARVARSEMSVKDIAKSARQEHQLKRKHVQEQQDDEMYGYGQH